MQLMVLDSFLAYMAKATHICDGVETTYSVNPGGRPIVHPFQLFLRNLLCGGKFSGVLYGESQIWEGKILVLLLRKEGKVWYKAPCWCLLVDGCSSSLVGSGVVTSTCTTFHVNIVSFEVPQRTQDCDTLHALSYPQKRFTMAFHYHEDRWEHRGM